MERIKTGITGFDSLIEGGFPRGRTLLVSGATGTGKTIFSMGFLYNGITKFNEPGVYVTLDERPVLLREDCMRFGWDLQKLETENKLTIVDGSIAKIGMPSEEEFSLPATGYDVDKLLLETIRTIKKINAKRVVIDSIPALAFNFETDHEVRKAVLKMGYMLSRAGVTTVMTSEIEEGEAKFSKYGVEEYIADGVIVLHYLGVGTQSTRHLLIRKMRATKHSEEIHPLEITSSGIKVKKIEDEYSNV